MLSVSGQGEQTELSDVVKVTDDGEKTTEDILIRAVKVCEMRKISTVVNGHDAEERMRGRTHVRTILRFCFQVSPP